MEVTDKTRIAFEEWFPYQYYDWIIEFEESQKKHLDYGEIFEVNTFLSIPEAMRYGVLVDFFLESKIDVIKMFYDFYRGLTDYTVDMARLKTIEKANEIYNGRD